VTPGSAGGASLVILIPAAFLAGILSFLSPCSLPLLPAYFAFTFQAQRGQVVLMTGAFFLGLATTMTVLGASATVISGLLFQNLQLVTTIGGVVIILFGLLSFFGKGFAGIQIQERPSATLLGSYLYGATFALGWTACIGPILGAILTLLATQGLAALQGALLTFVYALGLAAPLMVISAVFNKLGNGTPFWRFIRGRGFEVNLPGRTLLLHTTSMLSGLLLIGLGCLIASGQLTALNRLAGSSALAVWLVNLEKQLGAFLGLY
jgi:cytochrome c-type biogenesis protein